ncbi:hypothetical protein AVEN_245023-1 [Araneus ventricosus]|uniref:Uncharacterized protein n=1 Tax=Araneus ventricosus TaxID=182803 RepID=A0A4Y2SL06_ARAVE|nr:hypothetical protein AVEN_200722-1 [Araneus ventricosus]GBN88875.1 hypothetical protein AVEN_15340-1 [Araneus ventricosus]GBO03157.1 hypothetical protein AVEN_4923-1 [Araneus ventricosus]GBO03160.1 hypothetical protein AVEN_245023-1 [Araneus ventricosus]
MKAGSPFSWEWYNNGESRIIPTSDSTYLLREKSSRGRRWQLALRPHYSSYCSDCRSRSLDVYGGQRHSTFNAAQMSLSSPASLLTKLQLNHSQLQTLLFIPFPTGSDVT